MSRPNRKRSAAFEWHTPTDEQGGQPPTIRLRHTNMSINDNVGRSSMQSSFITAPASPSKAARTDRIYQEDYLLHQMGLNAEVDYAMEGLDEDEGHGEGDGEDELAVDPDYQSHLDDNLLGAAKPKRTQVCWCIYSLFLVSFFSFSFAEEPTPHMAR